MVAIESRTGIKLISNVLYVPDIDQNLVSVRQLVEKGFKVVIENKMCVIKDNSNSDVLRIEMKGKSFSLDPMEKQQVAYLATTTNVQLWHKILGYFHHATLLNMQRKELALDLPQIDSELPSCKACYYGKQGRLTFKQATWSVTA